MRVSARRSADLPPLAWLARLRTDDPDTCNLVCGEGVEVGEDWFFEGGWDGDFGELGFHRTDIVTGSGARAVEDGFRFVSSGNTLNRLHHVRRGSNFLVSNSLPFLLSEADLHLDAGYQDYRDDIFSIIRGLDGYRSGVPVSGGSVQLLYFENLHWDGTDLRTVPKPRPARDFTSYENYAGFLMGALDRLIRNAGDARRSFPYEPLGTLSGGYDSPACMSLARACGCVEALHIAPDQKTHDSAATDIAQYLDVRLESTPLAAWLSDTEVPEPHYIAGTPDAEDIRFHGARWLLANRLLITGAWGDMPWDPFSQRDARNLRRMDTQGLSLSEARLWTGYQVVSVPMMGGLQLEDIRALGRSASMEPWRIGGHYDRPIPRRLAEEGGVPRGAFALGKMGQSRVLWFRDHYLTPNGREDYSKWLDDHRDQLPWLARTRSRMRMDKAFFRTGEAMYDALTRTPYLWRYAGSVRILSPVRRLLFNWAVDRLRTKYSAAVRDTR